MSFADDNPLLDDTYWIVHKTYGTVTIGSARHVVPTATQTNATKASGDVINNPYVADLDTSTTVEDCEAGRRAVDH